MAEAAVEAVEVWVALMASSAEAIRVFSGAEHQPFSPKVLSLDLEHTSLERSGRGGQILGLHWIRVEIQWAQNNK